MPPTPPTPLPPRRPFVLPEQPPRRRFNRLAIYLAFGTALLFIPLTLHYQAQRAVELAAAHRKLHPVAPTPPPTIEETGDQSVPAEMRQWHMQGVDGLVEEQARQRFGKPIFSRDYNLTYGAFLGPRFGLKHYYLTNSPGFEQREADAQVEWKYPQYSAVRELIWKLRESYITLWLAVPRLEIDLQQDDASALLRSSKPDQWVVLDNYRVGEDLVKNPPSSTATPPPTPAP